MVAYITTPVRALLLAAALLFAAQTADAGRSTNEPTATARTTARTKTEAAAEPDDNPLGGVLIIAGVVGALILLAWIGSRIGDNHSHVTS